MKKKIIISAAILAVVVSLVLFLPVKVGIYDDGGTRTSYSYGVPVKNEENGEIIDKNNAINNLYVNQGDTENIYCSACKADIMEYLTGGSA